MKKIGNAWKWVVLGIVLLLGGCEADPVNGTVFITPDSIVIRDGQAVIFTATGGFEYEWDLEQESYGTLSTRRGASTTYTSLVDPGAGTNLSQVIRVTSVLSGATTTNSAQVTSGTAEAFVTHIN